MTVFVGWFCGRFFAPIDRRLGVRAPLPAPSAEWNEDPWTGCDSVDARLGRSVVFVAGGYGRDRGRRIAPPSAVRRWSASFRSALKQTLPRGGERYREKALEYVPFPFRNFFEQRFSGILNPARSILQS